MAATRGTRPLPLDPLPSSLCSGFKDRVFLTNVNPSLFRTSEERKSPWRETGSGNPCPTLGPSLCSTPVCRRRQPHDESGHVGNQSTHIRLIHRRQRSRPGLIPSPRNHNHVKHQFQLQPLTGPTISGWTSVRLENTRRTKVRPTILSIAHHHTKTAPGRNGGPHG